MTLAGSRIPSDHPTATLLPIESRPIAVTRPHRKFERSPHLETPLTERSTVSANITCGCLMVRLGIGSSAAIAGIASVART
jgi:hypothetical protein